MKYFIPLTCIIFSCLFVSAQKQPDDLLTKIKNLKLQPQSFTNDTTLLCILTQTSEELNEEESFNFSKEAILLADKIMASGAGNSQTRIYFLKSIALNNVGVFYTGRAAGKEALDYFYKSLTIQEEILKQAEGGNVSLVKEIKKALTSSLNNIGVIYNSQGQFEEALNYFHKSLKIKAEDLSSLANTHNNIGLIYKNQKRLKEALDYLSKALELQEKINDKRGIGYSLNNIGFIHKDRAEIIRMAGGNSDSITSELKKALNYYEKSLIIQREIGNKKGIAYSLGNIGTVHFKQNNYSLALTYHDSSLKLSKQIGIPENIRNSEDLLSKIYLATGKQKEAFEHYRQYIIFRDSVSNQAIRKEGLKKQMQYEFEKKAAFVREEQVKKEAIHKEELKRQKIINWSASGTFVLALLSALLLFNRSRLKQKNKHQKELNHRQKEQADAVMETQEQERKRIAEDLHDSLGHLLSTTKLNLQTLPAGQTQIENSLHLLNQATDEIRNITFNLMPRTLEEGGLIPALNELALRVTNAGSVKVLLHVHNMEKFILEKQSQFNIYRIIQEAVNNILKHANANEINIQLLGQSDHISIMVEDDGKGFDPLENKSGRGLKNIATRSLWLKGKINIDSRPGHGTTITTEIPL